MNKSAIATVVATGVAAASIGFAIMEHAKDSSTIVAKNRAIQTAQIEARSADAKAVKLQAAPVTQEVTQYVFGHSTLMGIWAAGVIQSGGLGYQNATPDDQTCSQEYSIVTSDVKLKVTIDRTAFMTACATNVDDTVNQDTNGK